MPLSDPQIKRFYWLSIMLIGVMLGLQAIGYIFLLPKIFGEVLAFISLVMCVYGCYELRNLEGQQKIYEQQQELEVQKMWDKFEKRVS